MTLANDLMLLWWANEGDALEHAYAYLFDACRIGVVRHALRLKTEQSLGGWCNGQGKTKKSQRRRDLERAVRELEARP